MSAANPDLFLNETIRPIIVLDEVLLLMSRVPAPMLWKEIAVGVGRPTWAAATNVSCPEACRQATPPTGRPDVSNEVTHVPIIHYMLTAWMANSCVSLPGAFGLLAGLLAGRGSEALGLEYR